ncbi:MAG: hypothetical protein VX793_12945 [Pseudomonadota bacterium]|nr:hypothetical protein [Pseudomonadota bacterium]
MKTFKYGSLALAVMLTACGGGSSSSGGGGSSGTATKTETGVFTDSAVEGIHYQTSPGNKRGTTTALGEYDYVEGDMVVFSIGDTALPAVTATGRVTPADMADGNDADVVINVLRLLQTLDDDDNPDNGISINQQTRDDFIGKDVEVNQPAASFEAEAEAAIGDTLVTAEDAEAHFIASQQADLRGSWIFVEPDGESSNGLGPNGEEVNVLTFMDYGRYVVAHKYGNDDQGPATVEWGDYDWDPGTGAVTFEVMGNSDGNGGLCGNDSVCSDTLRLVGGELLLGSEAGAETPFQPVQDSGNDYVGAWYLPEGLGFNVLTILDGKHYVVAHSDNAEAYEGNALVAASSEWGTYSIINGLFKVTGVEEETDGPGGLYDASSDGEAGASASIEATAYGDLNMAFEEEDSITFGRIGRFAVDLEDLAGNTRSAVVEREEDGFFEGMMIDFSIDLVGESDKVNIYLNEDGTGTLTFSPGTEDEAPSTIDAPWTALDSGTLVFTETMSDGSTGSWRLAPVKNRNSDSVIVDFRHVDGGTESLLGFFISDVANPVSENEVLAQ